MKHLRGEKMDDFNIYLQERNDKAETFEIEEDLSIYANKFEGMLKWLNEEHEQKGE